MAHHFGIHNPFSADYLQHWGNTPEDLRAELEIVRKTAAYIIGRMERPNTNPEEGLPDSGDDVSVPGATSPNP